MKSKRPTVRLGVKHPITIQVVRLRSDKPGGARVVRYKKDDMVEIACFRPSGHRDFRRGKLRNAEMGAVTGVDNHKQFGLRHVAFFVTRPMAVALHKALSHSLYRDGDEPVETMLIPITTKVA